MIDRVADCFDGQRVRLLPVVVTDAAPGGASATLDSWWFAWEWAPCVCGFLTGSWVPPEAVLTCHR